MLNPIVRREARTSLRGWRIFFSIAAYVACTVGITIVFINANLSYSYYSTFDPRVIVYLYAILAGMQLGFILIATPSLTASSISGERERQTLDLLLTTKMSPFAIVSGKLLSGISIILLMIVATMPVYGILFYFGGVSILNMLGITLYNLLTACMVGSVSIFFSTIFKKTIMSMVVVYLLFGFLVFGTLIIYLIYVYGVSVIMQTYNTVPITYFAMALNPAAGFFSIIDAQIGSIRLDNFLGIYTNNVAFPVPIWCVNVVSFIAISIAFLKLAAMNINPLRRK